MPLDDDQYLVELQKEDNMRKLIKENPQGNEAYAFLLGYRQCRKDTQDKVDELLRILGVKK